MMHPAPAERLLSMLEEDHLVEALPANEVRAELAAFGIDPARSIAFARSLARDGGSPGGRLMGALLAAEEEDEEIARIESADIKDVRARVHHGAAAGIAAEARRKAGIDDNVVGLDVKRRKRRRLIVWGGPLAGIAASLLVVVVFMGNAYLSRERSAIYDSISAQHAEAPAPEMPNPALEGYIKPGPDKSLTDELLALGAPPELEAGESAKEKSFADSAPARQDEDLLALNEPAPDDEKGDFLAEPKKSLRKQEEFAAAPSASSPKPVPGVIGRARAPDAGTATSAAEAEPVGDVATVDARGTSSPGSAALPEIIAPREYKPAEELAGEAIAAAPSAEPGLGAGLARNVEISEIAAVLVLDPSQAPLQTQSPILPSGELAGRVEEARRLAGDRPVIALYTVATGPARQDFAQVPLQPGLTQQMVAPPPLVGLLGVEATEYDFIPLPTE